ncbi:unnamed protein product [Camellia sinensis]
MEDDDESKLENLSFMYSNAQDYAKAKRRVAELYKKHEKELIEENKILMKKIEDDQFLDLMTLKTKFSLVNCLFVLKSFYSTAGGAANQGALGPFGLLVLADESLSEQTPIYFYVAKGAEGKLKTFFCADESRSSKATDVMKPIYRSTVPVLKGEKFSMRILVNHSIVESFAQRGRTCITSRIYPTKAIYEDAKIFLFNNATEANIIASLKIWQMDSAYIHSYPTELIM